MMPTAIVIDDYADLTELLECRLNLLGIDVVAKGCNGMEAFELYRALGPDFVFMDVSMPVHDGFSGFEKIMRLDRDARIIMMTADKSDETREKLLRIGAGQILYKPIDASVLKASIELERKRLGDAITS